LLAPRFPTRRFSDPGGFVVAELTGFVARLDASLQSGGEVASRSDEPAVEFGVRSLDRSRIVGVEGSIRVGRLLAVIKLTEKTRLLRGFEGKARGSPQHVVVVKRGYLRIVGRVV